MELKVKTKEMTRIDGKVAIVTGSGNGIGRAIAMAMADAGAKVTVSDLLQEDGERTVKEITDRGGTAIFAAAAPLTVEIHDGVVDIVPR